jgi:hypothetical protein
MTKMKKMSKIRINKTPTKLNLTSVKATKSYDEGKFNCSASGLNTC